MADQAHEQRVEGKQRREVRFEQATALRPAGWTSGDAAGLPMFPALLRFDECERGMVEHACRIVVAKSRKEYIYPATHYAAPDDRGGKRTARDGPARAAQGELCEFVDEAGKGGVAGVEKIRRDGGGQQQFFSISVTPDDRWPAGCFDHFNTISITNFEVIQTTGPNEGPRSSRRSTR